MCVLFDILIKIHNVDTGIQLGFSSNNKIIDRNEIKFNSIDGIYLEKSSYNNITDGNKIGNNNRYGIYLVDSSHNTISAHNYIYENGKDGVHLEKSSSNIFSWNEFYLNADYGVNLIDSSDYNKFYHNEFYRHVENAWDDCSNYWNNGEIGNFWDDYTTKYPNAESKNGYWDTPYSIKPHIFKNKDNYPICYMSKVHNIDTGEDYSTIQGAIENSSDGNTILVDKGVYFENLIVDRSVQLIGEDDEDTIIYGTSNESVVEIIADYVTIEGFTITSKYDDSGIYLAYKSRNNTISNNIIENCRFGVEIGDRCTGNVISYNFIQDCRSGGIFSDAFHWCGENTILNNRIRNINGEAAIHLSKSSYSYIGGNFIKDCYKGVELYTSLSTSCFNIIASNVFDNCSDYDVYLYDAGYANTVFGNDFLNKDDTRKAAFENTVITFWYSNYWGGSAIRYKIHGHLIIESPLGSLGGDLIRYDLKPAKEPQIPDYQDFVWP